MCGFMTCCQAIKAAGLCLARALPCWEAQEASPARTPPWQSHGELLKRSFWVVVAEATLSVAQPRVKLPRQPVTQPAQWIFQERAGGLLCRVLSILSPPSYNCKAPEPKFMITRVKWGWSLGPLVEVAQ